MQLQSPRIEPTTAFLCNYNRQESNPRPHTSRDASLPLDYNITYEYLSDALFLYLPLMNFNFSISCQITSLCAYKYVCLIHFIVCLRAIDGSKCLLTRVILRYF